MTSKLQVTIPKALAIRYGIEPGTEIEFLPAGEAIRVVTPRAASSTTSRVERRLELFDAATERQLARARRFEEQADADRGWRREELYGRGIAR